MRSRSWPRSARGRARPPGEEGPCALHSNPDHRSGSPRAAAPARQRGPGLRLTARPLYPAFCSGLGCFPPTRSRPSCPSQEGSEGRARRTAGTGCGVLTPLRLAPDPAAQPGGGGATGLGEGSRGEVPSARRATAPPAPPGRRGTGSRRPPGRRRRSGASAPTPTAGGARPRPRPLPRATESEHAHCAARAPWGLACAGG